MTTAHRGYSIFPGMQESDDEHLAGIRILMPTITPILIVKSVYRSVEWYQRLLGFESVYLNEQSGEDDSLNYAVLRAGSISIHLGREADMSMLAGNSSCQINTDRFDDCYQLVRQENAALFLALGRNPVGERTFGITDPDGNQIVITESVIAPVSAHAS